VVGSSGGGTDGDESARKKLESLLIEKIVCDESVITEGLGLATAGRDPWLFRIEGVSDEKKSEVGNLLHMALDEFGMFDKI